ncbi:MAG: hypothetical protein HY975_03285 [Candidatus Kerfeldbacteria bacterium]|nr:hypothetical protein [Candidatus Kerfeldbacteria bacterium]
MPRRLLIIIIAFVVLIGGSLAVILAVNNSPTLQNTVQRIANLPRNTTNTVATNTTSPTATADADRARVIFVARTFAEIYGSGSNQNNFSNLTDAQAYSTKTFASVLQAQIAQGRLTNVTTPYHGFVTKTLVVNFTKLTTTTASVVVSTQRDETLDVQSKTYTQNLEIQLQKTGGEWQVNAAQWLAV